MAVAMEDAYNRNVEAFRGEEYPMLQDQIYLDHAGAALYSKTFMETYVRDMMSNLYGNPHSASTSSQLSTSRIEDVRLKVLRFFNADPEEFDLIFVANATAGVKLVMEALREVEGGFHFGYHRDSHTSLVGVRESAKTSLCLDDEDVEQYLSRFELLLDVQVPCSARLFAYPAQSNMDGRRLPLSWIRKARALNDSAQSTYTLLDVSAFVSTSQLDMSDIKSAADFTVLSFYKIFGFPDLGALIVRKDCGSIFRDRKYFGGGTVDAVLCGKETWHAPKTQSLHDSLEDGTLPFHSIMALDAAIDVHRHLYGSMDAISSHTTFLAQTLYDGLASLQHANSMAVCVMHSHGFYSENVGQGPIVAFNLRNSYGAWVSNSEFEKLASVRRFHIRSGGLCNPGGVAKSLDLEPWEIRKNFSAGFRCGNETDIYAGKITGVIRASLGAMSTISDVYAFISFVREFYVESETPVSASDSVSNQASQNMFVESMTIYPIKSCGGLEIAANTDWEVRPEGLAWDREWCLIHQGTGQALSQKRHPRMVLIRPELDFAEGLLRVRYHDPRGAKMPEEMCVPLSVNPSFFLLADGTNPQPSRVCGDAIIASTYAKAGINEFFTKILGVPCALARFPAGGSGFTTRHSKAHMQRHQRPRKSLGNEGLITGLSLAPLTPPDSDNESRKRPILLSNESPILAINRASLDLLNKEIATTGGKAASAAVFRANIVLAPTNVDDQKPYSEDHWATLHIGQQQFQMLGSCRRCHMICVDQSSGEKDEEPFVTLARTRRFESKIFFGSHMCHLPSKNETKESQYPTIRVGDVVTAGLETS